MTPSARGALPAVARHAMVCVAVLLSVAALVAAYVRAEVSDPEAFASRAVSALQAPEVRAVIAEELAVELLERRSPKLLAARPLVLAAVEALLDTDAFERILRRAAVTAHEVLLAGERDAVIELREARAVLGPALESAVPRLARQLPDDLTPQIAALRANDATSATVRLANGASALAIPLLVASLLCLAAVVTLAPDRRRAAGSSGLALAAGMGGGIVAIALLRAEAMSHVASLGVLSEEEVRAAAGAAWDAFAADLERILVIVGAGGVAVWAGSWLAEARIDRSKLIEGAAQAVAGGNLARPARLARGVLIALLGALVLLRAEPVHTVVVAGLACGLVLLGLGEALAAAGSGRHVSSTSRRRRRRGFVAAGAAVAAAAVAVGVAWLGRSDPTEPIPSADVRACNGMEALCERRLDEVVLAGTHNSMSAASRPGWFFANQSRPIPRQLEDGVRLLMIDPHYGVVDREGRVRTDLRAEGTSRNRVARRLGLDAVEAAESLAGRLGLVPAEGERQVFLCHTLCELGAERFGPTLDEIRGWLEHNRSEVLVVMLESSVAPAEIEQAFEKADLEPYLATLPRAAPLPTLRSMIASGRRLVVLDEGDGGDAPWHQPAFVLAQATSIQAFTDEPASCEAGRGTPESPLLIMNHWVDAFPPSPAAARDVNQSALMRQRIAACERRLGRAPNVIAADFYETGDVIELARELNEAAPPAPDVTQRPDDTDR